MSPTLFCASLLLWAIAGLPITIVISLWAIYRAVLGGRLDFWSWAEKMINRRTK